MNRILFSFARRVAFTALLAVAAGTGCVSTDTDTDDLDDDELAALAEGDEDEFDDGNAIAPLPYDRIAKQMGQGGAPPVGNGIGAIGPGGGDPGPDDWRTDTSYRAPRERFTRPRGNRPVAQPLTRALAH